MTSSPDRPFATLTEADLDARIARNREQQAMAVAGGRSAAAKRVLAMLKQEMAQLIAERNWRADMQVLPF